jgi:N,N'-diacetyllegionaminate synthase
MFTKPIIIAEVAQAHEGSLALAHSYIDAIADSGVDAVKFQTHIASAESTRDDLFRIRLSSQDHDRWSYWKRMEFTVDQWIELREHASRRSLLFLSSPFSIEAVDILSRVGLSMWKVGSGEVFNRPLLRAISEKGAPLLLSSGLSNWEQLDELVNFLKGTGCEFGLAQCTSRYPSSFRDVGLNVIREIKDRYSCFTGLSDHSGSAYPSMAAIAQGADFVEVHVVFDRRMIGPDASSSLNFCELEELRKFRDAFIEMRDHPTDKLYLASDLVVTRRLFGRSLAVKQNLSAGTIIDESHLTLKKPGDGIPYDSVNKILGRTLRKDVSPDYLLRWSDFYD